MSSLPIHLHTAGKITVLTSLVGVAVFMAMFMLNLGADELQRVEAQSTATTSITVLNTPPQWIVDAEEEIGSSTSTPTNSGSVVSWVATAADSNDAPYFLLICDTSATPTANAAASYLVLGTEPPECASGIQWAVSTATPSNTEARAATTTREALPESNNWYAWVCDDDPVLPRCNNVFKQGTGTTSSPFYVNHRPEFTAFVDNSPALPGQPVTFTATASDDDVVTSPDTVRLIVCSTNVFNTATDTCGATTLATSSLAASNPSGVYTIVIPTRDANYGAFGFVVDNHGHEAQGGAHGTDSVLTVGNAAPYVNSGDITLNGGTDIVLTVPAGQTTGFTMSFLASDNNSCRTITDTNEIVDWEISVSRTNIATSSCDQAGDYNANYCYTSTVPTTTWNISCTASTTSCTGATDLNVLYNCTFPLWYIADPTDGGATNTPQFNTNWSASVAPIDDDGAQGVLSRGSIGQELASFLYFTLDTLAIAYGELEPGQFTDPLVATTTIRATGNVALDQLLSGESMCPTYTSSVTCPVSSTSTIDVSNQVYGTSSVTYTAAQGAGNILDELTNELELNVPKSTSTLTQSAGVTYWGIAVPGTITLAGAYTGENTFFGVVAEVADW